MPREREESRMRCPSCKRFALRRKELVVCTFCGYQLSPGEEVRFRLYELLE